MYSKANNAGNYHGNFYVENVLRLGMNLRRMDYNEPRKGKGQCDRESTLVRNATRCYIDEGNDLISANDIHKALSQSNVINSPVSVVSFNKRWISGTKIDNIHHLYEISSDDTTINFG